VLAKSLIASASASAASVKSTGISVFFAASVSRRAKVSARALRSPMMIRLGWRLS